MYTAKCDYYLPYLFTLIRNPWLPVEPKSPPYDTFDFQEYVVIHGRLWVYIYLGPYSIECLVCIFFHDF